MKAQIHGNMHNNGCETKNNITAVVIVCNHTAYHKGFFLNMQPSKFCQTLETNVYLKYNSRVQ